MIALAAALAIPQVADAATVFEDDQLALVLDEYGRAGYNLVLPSEKPARHEAEVLHARVGTRATYQGIGSMRLQLDASNPALAMNCFGAPIGFGSL
ncbi:MAG: hypothetical protein ACJAYU_001122 [Bradymonadia bacterium]|jgi:hypothetical protein